MPRTPRPDDERDVLKLGEVLLPHETTLPVLGLQTLFTTNDSSMLEIVDESFGMWRDLDARALDARELGAEDVARVRIVVVSDDERDARDADDGAITHEMSDDLRFVARSAGSVAESDPARRAATIRVTRVLAADRERFRTEMLEAVVLALLSCDDRHPVHAAAVANGGRAALFAAPSGTGKSTLAYACHEAGLDLLGDDHVRIQLAPSPRVWGWPGRVRLLAGTAARMGVADAPVRSVNGKSKAVVDARRDVGASRLVADDATVCVLTRDGGGVSLEPLAPDALAHALEAQLAPGFDRFPARWPSVLRALTEHGGWRLNLSSDAREAVPLVRKLLDVS